MVASRLRLARALVTSERSRPRARSEAAKKEKAKGLRRTNASVRDSRNDLNVLGHALRVTINRGGIARGILNNFSPFCATSCKKNAPMRNRGSFADLFTDWPRRRAGLQLALLRASLRRALSGPDRRLRGRGRSGCRFPKAPLSLGHWHRSFCQGPAVCPL